MKAKFVFLTLGLAVAGTAFVPTGPVEAKGVCSTKHGKGWAPTQDMAKFQAWEIVAQTTATGRSPPTSWSRRSTSARRMARA